MPRTNTGAAVANQDLWKKLEAKIREMEKEGMLVQFWWIPRGWNEADSYAKAGAVGPLYSKSLNLHSVFTVLQLGQGHCHWRSWGYHYYGADAGIVETCFPSQYDMLVTIPNIDW